LRDIERKLSERYGQTVTHVTVGSILETLGYRKQANQKMLQVGNPILIFDWRFCCQELF
jgi:hypothetical protein